MAALKSLYRMERWNCLLKETVFPFLICCMPSYKRGGRGSPIKIMDDLQFIDCKYSIGKWILIQSLLIFQEPIAESSTYYAHLEIMANNIKIESDDDSLSDDSLEVSDTVTGVTNLTSDTILDSPDKISCALCVTRTKGNKHQPARQESGQQYPLLLLSQIINVFVYVSHVTTVSSKFPRCCC